MGDATKPFFYHSGNEQKDHRWDIFSEYIWKPLQQAPAYENIPPFDELSVTNEDSIKAIKIYIYTSVTTTCFTAYSQGEAEQYLVWPTLLK